ncbi:MAG: adenylate/guanylate cyclase domain-containing protein [Pseudomonadota bacterium]
MIWHKPRRRDCGEYSLEMATQIESTEATVPHTAGATPARPQTSAAILFADVCGSTKIYEALGDVAARKLIGRCVQLMTEATREHEGALVKTIGDEVMCRFPTADAAAAAALDMQERVAAAALAERGFSVAIHVGFHFGPVVEESGDVYGDAVNLASRMVSLAKRDQILTTGGTRALLSPRWADALRQVDRTTVKGKDEVIDVYDLVWQEAETTRVAGRVWDKEHAADAGHLLLTLGGQITEVSAEHPSATAGRAEQNDIVVQGDLISRLHARIDYRSGRFSLTDQSTNGTYVTDASGAEHLVRHDTFVLTGAGTISFGHPVLPEQKDLLRYTVIR